MSKTVALRIDDELLSAVDRARRARHLTRTRAVHDALRQWLARQEQEVAIRQEHDGYARKPITKEEFSPVLGAQVWPR